MKRVKISVDENVLLNLVVKATRLNMKNSEVIENYFDGFTDLDQSKAIEVISPLIKEIIEREDYLFQYSKWFYLHENHYAVLKEFAKKLNTDISRTFNAICLYGQRASFSDYFK